MIAFILPTVHMENLSIWVHVTQFLLINRNGRGTKIGEGITELACFQRRTQLKNVKFAICGLNFNRT